MTTQESERRSKVLMSVFGLTHAEARVALALLETRDIKGAAVQCGITVGSARQYLKRVFSKSNTTGQVDLVITLMNLLLSQVE